MSLVMMATCWNQAIIAAGVGRQCATFRREIFRQIEKLVGQPESCRARAKAEDAFEMLVAGTFGLILGELPKREHSSIEFAGAIKVGHGHPDGIERCNRRRNRSGFNHGRQNE
jgi:hypothetical protein